MELPVIVLLTIAHITQYHLLLRHSIEQINNKNQISK